MSCPLRIRFDGKIAWHVIILYATHRDNVKYGERVA